MTKYTIFCRNRIFKQALNNIMSNISDFNYFDCSNDSEICLEQIKQNTPGFIFIDLNCHGINDDFVSEVFNSGLKTKIVLITSKLNPYIAYYFQKYKISNFIYIEDDEYETRQNIKKILLGDNGFKKSDYPSMLTTRECEVLKLISQGKTSKEIADILFISKNTVDTHRNKILQKLNIANSASLVKHAYVSGLV